MEVRIMIYGNGYRIDLERSFPDIVSAYDPQGAAAAKQVLDGLHRDAVHLLNNKVPTGPRRAKIGTDDED